MKSVNKSQKEQRLITAAETVFAKTGFVNSKMEDIAKEAGITKVTLYSYFKSKENLQLAVTHKALKLLIAKYNKTIGDYSGKSGLESSIALFQIFIEFNEENYLYSEALLSYFELIRSTSQGLNKNKVTEGIRESIYFGKLQEIQNLPFKITVKEINRGKKDGSVKIDIDPMLVTLAAWSSSIGYVKLLSASGNKVAPLFQVDLPLLKNMQLKTAMEYLKP